ncbi:MAG: hypothetical protein NTX50_17910 [Candidatus Sumerlaeota bacterium]|nr:hypothetical protein [Candidatus Sumerlaeota bacterium]
MNPLNMTFQRLWLFVWLWACLVLSGLAARAQDRAPAAPAAKATPKSSGASATTPRPKSDAASPAKNDAAAPKKSASSTKKTVTSTSPTAPKKDNFLESVGQLEIVADVSDMVLDAKTNEIISMVYTGNVHFILDQVDLYSDKMEVIEGKNGAERTAVATCNPGNRVIIYSFDRAIMAICDKYVYYTVSKKSILTCNPDKRVLTYQVQSNGSIRKINSEKTIIDQSATTTVMHMESPIIKPVKAEDENLPPAQKKRLLEFVSRMMKQYAEKGLAAKPAGANVPKATPKATPKVAPTPAPRTPATEGLVKRPSAPEPPAPESSAAVATSAPIRIRSAATPQAGSRMTPRPAAKAPAAAESDSLNVPSREAKTPVKTPKPAGKRPQIEE